jgi:hypothetical protein
MYRYVGLRPEGDRVPLPDDTVPALVDKATFDAVQERLCLNKQDAVQPARNPERALLSGGLA